MEVTAAVAGAAYSLAMLLMPGLTQTAEEGVRAAAALSWLPAKSKQQVVDGNRISAVLAGNLVTVTVTYPNYATNGLLPTLTIPLIGAVPHMPTNLVGEASLQI